jgi:putative membrane protein
MMFPMMFFGWIVWLLLAVAAVIGLTRFSTRPRPENTSSTGPQRTGESPEEILQARYARGEITQEEFEEVRETLR